MVIAAILLVTSVILYATEKAPFDHLVMLSLLGTFFLLAGLLCIAALSTAATQLEKFDEYEKSVQEKWPDVFS